MSMKRSQHEDDYKEEGINNLAKAKKHFWYLYRNKIIRDLIGQFNKETPYILDLGAGSGNVSAYLLEKGFKVVASDLYQSGVEIMKGSGINAFQYDLLNNSPPPEENLNAYDIVILGDVIEHLDDPIQALKNASKFLGKGGGVLVAAPALMSLWSQYDIFCGHKRRYSRKLLTEHLQAAGYNPSKVRYFMFFPGLILLVTRKIINRTHRDIKEFSNDLEINPIINSIMNILITLEYWLQKLIYVPFGSSIYGIALLKHED